MDSHVRTPLSLLQNLGLAYKLVVWLCRIPYQLARLLFNRELHGNSNRIILLVAILKARSHLDLITARDMSPTTSNTIMRFCNARGLKHSVITIDCGANCPPARLHKIMYPGDTKPKSALVYYHGGGYISPLSGPSHMPLVINCASIGLCESIYILEYGLAPSLKYPGQLIQAVAAMDTILKTHNPADILVGGDSAGGHLALGLLAHMIRPHPDVPELAKIRFRGVFLLSPWVSMDTDSPTYASNAASDYISPIRLRQALNLWLNPSNQTSCEPYLAPCSGDEMFWRGLLAQKMFISGGGKEVFFHDIQYFAETLLQAQAYKQGSAATISFSVGKGEVHVQGALEVAVRLSPSGTAAQLQTWLAELNRPETPISK